MLLPHYQAMRRHIEAAARDAEQGGHRSRENEPVQTIHHAAMTGDQCARILGVESRA